MEVLPPGRVDLKLNAANARRRQSGVTAKLRRAHHSPLDKRVRWFLGIPKATLKSKLS